MSTPSWPVPYYQRLVKAYPIRFQYPADDVNWITAKHTLNQSLYGRQVVAFTENHLKTKSYLIQKDDCQTMVKAYVNDIGQFLNLANRQNVKILSDKTMI